jgi:hypothetical protein
MDAYAPLRREAVTLLGLLGNRAAVPHLQRLMNDGESSRGDLRAGACKSLLRLGAEVSDATVSTLYREPIGMLGRLDILIGLSSVRREELLLSLLSRDRECLQSRRWMEAAFMTAAELYQRREMADYFFRAGAKQRDSQGLLLLREFGEVLNTEPALKTALENRDTAQMASLLNRLNPPGFPKMDPHGPPAAVYAWALLWCARQEYQQTESGGTS